MELAAETEQGTWNNARTEAVVYKAFVVEDQADGQNMVGASNNEFASLEQQCERLLKVYHANAFGQICVKCPFKSPSE